MEIINLTPHDIKINNKLYPGAGQNAARAKSDVEVIDNIDGIDVLQMSFYGTINLPEPEEGKAYIVSKIVAEVCKDRDDLFLTAKPVRDKNRRIVGCRALSRLARD